MGQLLSARYREAVRIPWRVGHVAEAGQTYRTCLEHRAPERGCLADVRHLRRRRRRRRARSRRGSRTGCGGRGRATGFAFAEVATITARRTVPRLEAPTGAGGGRAARTASRPLGQCGTRERRTQNESPENQYTRSHAPPHGKQSRLFDPCPTDKLSFKAVNSRECNAQSLVQQTVSGRHLWGWRPLLHRVRTQCLRLTFRM